MIHDTNNYIECSSSTGSSIELRMNYTILIKNISEYELKLEREMTRSSPTSPTGLYIAILLSINRSLSKQKNHDASS